MGRRLVVALYFDFESPLTVSHQLKSRSLMAVSKPPFHFAASHLGAAFICNFQQLICEHSLKRVRETACC